MRVNPPTSREVSIDGLQFVIVNDGVSDLQPGKRQLMGCSLYLLPCEGESNLHLGKCQFISVNEGESDLHPGKRQLIGYSF
jgi:hypothetical protein